MDQNWYSVWPDVHVHSWISPACISKNNVSDHFSLYHPKNGFLSGDKVHKIGLLIADKNFDDKFNIEVESITGFK